MKKNILFIFCLFASSLLRAQTGDDYSAIKLFIESDSEAMKKSDLPEKLQTRLYSKITQLINQTGIAEVGYSNFLVIPKFDILSTSVDQAGISSVHLAECELFISVSRRAYANEGAASYASFTKKIVGSGLSKDEAISNAISSISPTDNAIVSFFNKAKIKINEYFQANCKDVIAEAEQAYNLNSYAKSIALYFSVPSNAPCYPAARKASIKVYGKFMEDECRKYLVELKALVATIQAKEDATSIAAYTRALGIIGHLNPSSTDCYAEALKEIEKIESRFNENQKNEWELQKKRSADNAEIQKEIAKGMARISSSYQPTPPVGNIIITK